MKKLKELFKKLADAIAKNAKALVDSEEAGAIIALQTEIRELIPTVKAADMQGCRLGDLDWAPKAAGSGDGEQDPNIVGIEALKDVVSEAVSEQLKAILPEDQVGAITQSDVKLAVTAALEDAAAKKASGEALKNADVQVAVKSVMDGFATSLKKAKKQTANTDDANEGGSIEIPLGESKGNLPVHRKQLCNILMGRPQDEGIDRDTLTKAIRHGDRMKEKAISAKSARAFTPDGKALTSTGSATGDELVPTDLSGELERRLYLESTLAQAHLANEIQMPTNPYELPISTTRPTFFLESTENTAATKSTPGTGKLTLTAAKGMAQVDFSYEVEEDAIIPVLGEIERLLGEAGAADFERALLSGDSTATHQDTDTEAIAKDFARAWKGYRKLALAVAGLKVDISSGGISRANLVTLKKTMGKYGSAIKSLAWIVGPLGENDMLNLTDVLTVDKRGLAATTLTGVLSSFLGIPIIMSEQNREDLNASGVDDGITDTKGSIILARLDQFRTGTRRGFVVEVDKNIKTQTREIVASYRKAFSPLETPSATIPSVVIGYNYTA